MKLKLTAILALTSFAAIAPVAHAAPGWSTPRTVEGAQTGAAGPMAVVDGSGRATVAWTTARSNYSAVRVASEDSPGNFGAATQISKADETSPRLSNMVGNANGDVVVVWCAGASGGSALRVGLGSAGQGITSGQTFSKSSTDECGDAAINDRGDAVLAWTTGGRVWIARRAPGAEFAAPREVRSPGTPFGKPALVVGQDGVASLIWATRIGGGFRVVLSRVSAGGAIGDPEFVSPSFSLGTPALAIDGGGGLGATWVDSGGSVISSSGRLPAGFAAETQPAGGLGSGPSKVRAQVSSGDALFMQYRRSTNSDVRCQAWNSTFQLGALGTQAAGLQVSSGEWPGAGFDAQGQAHLIWTSKEIRSSPTSLCATDGDLISSQVNAVTVRPGTQPSVATNVSDPRFPATESTLNETNGTVAASWVCFDGRKYRVQVATYGSTAGSAEWCGAADAKRPTVKISTARYPMRWRSNFKYAPRARCNEQCSATTGLLMFSAGKRAIRLGVAETILRPDKHKKLAFPKLTTAQKRRVGRIVRTRRGARFVYRLRIDDLALNSRLVTRRVYLRP